MPLFRKDGEEQDKPSFLVEANGDGPNKLAALRVERERAREAGQTALEGLMKGLPEDEMVDEAGVMSGHHSSELHALARKTGEQQALGQGPAAPTEIGAGAPPADQAAEIASAMDTARLVGMQVAEQSPDQHDAA